MSDDLSEIECLDDAADTGVDACAFDPKMIVSVVLTPKNWQLSLTAMQGGDATVLDALQAAALIDNKALRIRPINNFEGIADSSEDLVVQTMPYGGKHVAREGMLDWRLQYVTGGLSLHKKLRTFNGNKYDFLLIDSNNQIIGTTGVDTDGNEVLQAISTNGGFFWSAPWKAADGSKVTEYGCRLVFAPKYVNDFVQFYAFGAGYDLPSLLVGIEAVALTSPSANVTSGSYNVVGKTVDSKTNIASLYPTQLAVIGAWKALNNTTGNVITILTAVLSANLGGPGIPGFIIGLDKTDADYPTSGDVLISMAGPTELAALDVMNIESNSIAIVKN